MKLPKKLNILGLEIKVEDKDMDSLGQYYHPDRTISINNRLLDLIKEDNTQTLIHEMIHVVMFRTGAYNTLSMDMTEVLCDSIAHAVAENFKLVPKKTKGN